jgi:hypothetical protein
MNRILPALAAAFLPGPAAGAAEAKKPNVVLATADDTPPS